MINCAQYSSINALGLGYSITRPLLSVTVYLVCPVRAKFAARIKHSLARTFQTTLYGLSAVSMHPKHARSRLLPPHTDTGHLQPPHKHQARAHAHCDRLSLSATQFMYSSIIVQEPPAKRTHRQRYHNTQPNIKSLSHRRLFPSLLQLSPLTALYFSYGLPHYPLAFFPSLLLPIYRNIISVQITVRVSSRPSVYAHLTHFILVFSIATVYHHVCLRLLIVYGCYKPNNTTCQKSLVQTSHYTYAFLFSNIIDLIYPLWLTYQSHLQLSQLSYFKAAS